MDFSQFSMFSFMNVSNKACLGELKVLCLWDFLLCHFHFCVFDASNFPHLLTFLLFYTEQNFPFLVRRLQRASKWTEPFSSWMWACVYSDNRENVEYRTKNRWSKFSFFVLRVFLFQYYLTLLAPTTFLHSPKRCILRISQISRRHHQ